MLLACNLVPVSREWTFPRSAASSSSAAAAATLSSSSWETRNFKLWHQSERLASGDANRLIIMLLSWHKLTSRSKQGSFDDELTSFAPSLPLQIQVQIQRYNLNWILCVRSEVNKLVALLFGWLLRWLQRLLKRSRLNRAIQAKGKFGGREIYFRFA